MSPKLTDMMNDWRSLTDDLYTLRESEVLEMLEWEKAHKKRKVFLIRLHQRYTVLRAARERMEFI